MEISPYLLFWLSVSSLLFGVAVGVLHDVHRLVRVFLGVRYGGKRLESWYRRPLPILRRPLEREGGGRIRRIALPVVIFFQDVLLFCFAGVGIVLLNFYFNRGQLRLYTPILLLLGFLLYYFTLGRLVMLLSEGVVFFVRAGCHILFYLFFYPFRQIASFFGKVANKLQKNVQNAIAIRRKKVYNIGKEKSVMKKSENGFLSGETFCARTDDLPADDTENGRTIQAKERSSV